MTSIRRETEHHSGLHNEWRPLCLNQSEEGFMLYTIGVVMWSLGVGLVSSTTGGIVSHPFSCLHYRKWLWVCFRDEKDNKKTIVHYPFNRAPLRTTVFRTGISAKGGVKTGDFYEQGTIIAIVLIVLGVAAFADQGINYKTRKGMDLGAVQVTAGKTKISLSPLCRSNRPGRRIILLVRSSKEGLTLRFLKIEFLQNIGASFFRSFSCSTFFVCSNTCTLRLPGRFLFFSENAKS